jgi:glycine betaine/proline transport system ATP-binding protein
MREPRESEATGGPELPVGTTLKDALPVVASTEQPVRAVKDGQVVGIVDREAILRAMAEDPDASGGRSTNGGS